MPYFEWKARNLDIKYYDKMLESDQRLASRWLMQSAIDIESGVMEADGPEEVVLNLAQIGLVPMQVTKINYEQYRIIKKVEDKIKFFKNRFKPKRAEKKGRRHIPLRYYVLFAVMLAQLLLIIWLLTRI